MNEDITISSLVEKNSLPQDYLDFKEEVESLEVSEDSNYKFPMQDRNKHLVIEDFDEVFRGSKNGEIISRKGDLFLRYSPKDGTYTWCKINNSKTQLIPYTVGQVEFFEDSKEKSEGESSMARIKTTENTKNVKKDLETGVVEQEVEKKEGDKEMVNETTTTATESKVPPVAPVAPAAPSAPTGPSVPPTPPSAGGVQKMNLYDNASKAKSEKTDEEKERAKREKERKAREEENRRKRINEKIKSMTGETKAVKPEILIRNNLVSEIKCYLVTKDHAIVLRTKNSKVEDPATYGKDVEGDRKYRIQSANEQYKSASEKSEDEKWFLEKSFVFRSSGPSPLRGALVKIPVDIFDLLDDTLAEEAEQRAVNGEEQVETVYSLMQKEVLYTTVSTFFKDQRIREASYMSDGRGSYLEVTTQLKDAISKSGQPITVTKLNGKVVGRAKFMGKNNYIPQKLFKTVDLVDPLSPAEVSQVVLSLAYNYVSADEKSIKLEESTKYNFVAEHQDFLVLDSSKPLSEGMGCKAITGAPIDPVENPYFKDVVAFYSSKSEGLHLDTLPVVLKEFKETKDNRKKLQESEVYDLAEYSKLSEETQLKTALHDPRFDHIFDLDGGAVREFLTADRLEGFFLTKSESKAKPKTIGNINQGQLISLIKKVDNGTIKGTQVNISSKATLLQYRSSLLEEKAKAKYGNM